jgi:hypothetical protein
MTEHDDLDLVLRALARLLAPYLREELGEGAVVERVTPSWDDAGAAEFVSGLKPEVIDRALELFHALAHPPHTIDSLRLAEQLGAKSPREVAGLLTTPIKRRTSATGRDLPWEERQVAGRTVWADRNGSATPIYHALEAASDAHRALRSEKGEPALAVRELAAVSVYQPKHTRESDGPEPGSCLRESRPGDRLAIYRSHQEQAIVALFDVGTDPFWDDNFRWMSYGYLHVLPVGISREELLADPVLATVFERIQGRRRLTADESRVLANAIAARQPTARLPEFVKVNRKRPRLARRRKEPT